MAGSVVPSESVAGAVDAGATTARFSVLARDLVGAGIAGAVAGVLVAGIGGRLVMRLAALAVPSSAGRFTENGNLIGNITLDGSVGLVLLGLFFGAFAAIVWVVVLPWLPGRGVPRALLAMPLALALGGRGLIDGSNTDFAVLQHQPVVVAMLVCLVAALGSVTALLADRLDRRLPPAGTESSGQAFGYALLIAAGVLLMPIVVVSFFDAPGKALVGLALVATGLATAAWWVLRFRGAARPPGRLVTIGRASLLVAVVAGSVQLFPEIVEALGG
jgi:hypothetical protein